MSHLSRKLESRHINMIALGGSIGTGLFLISGYAISIGGPAGTVCAYLIMSIIVYFLMMCLAEMSAYKPTSGSFCDYSTHYINKSFGFAISYIYWFSWVTAFVMEISASSLIISYWFPHVNTFAINVVLFVLISSLNLCMVKIYGETEYWLSFLKVTAILIFITLGIIKILSIEKLGFINWQIKGAPFHDGTYGLFSVLLLIGLSFQGTELVGITSDETKNPSSTIPFAIKAVFWRLTLFYILTTLIITLLIPFNDPRLATQDNILMSPYTLLLSNYFGRYAGDIMNLVILISLISAANASLYSSSRILWYIGKASHGPKILSNTNKSGIPIFSLSVTTFISALLLSASINGNADFFKTITQISALTGFIVWLSIAASHYCFRHRYLPKHKINVSELAYKTKYSRLFAIISIIIILSIIVAQFYTIPKNENNLITIFSTYLSVIIFLILYIGHQLFTKIHKFNLYRGAIHNEKTI